MISLPIKPKVIQEKGNKATFEIKSLYPGYGITVGNALRRVLVSSLEGAAITQIRIKDVSHEFSTIPGVLEDVISIVLNLKKMRFKMFSDEPQTAKLEVKGKKEVKGSDFKVPSQLELVSKDLHIATLTSKKANLEIEAKIERGIGYQLKDQEKEPNIDVGVILMDAIFSPIQKVAFRVENMRVGDRTDFDRLFIDVETDGTITPQKALGRASSILLQHFQLIGEDFVEKEESDKKEKKTKKTKKKATKKETKKKKAKKTKKKSSKKKEDKSKKSSKKSDKKKTKKKSKKKK